MAQCRTIFPLILFFPPLIFPVIPCPSLSALLCPHQDGTQKVQWGSLIRNFHGWLEPTFHCPSLDISLGKNSSRRYDWGGSTEKLEAKPLALKIKRCAVGNATARTSRVSQPSTLKSFKDLCCILSISSEKIFQWEVFFLLCKISFRRDGQKVTQDLNHTCGRFLHPQTSVNDAEASSMQITCEQTNKIFV